MENYSVLMSVYAKEKPEYLIESCKSLFEQTVATNDFVLVCDGPLTEELDAAISQLKQTYGETLNVVRFPTNRGLGPALNDGLKICKNRLVARMDSDDISEKNRAQLQLSAFALNEKLTILSGTVEEFEGSVENAVSKRKLPLTDEEIKIYAKRRCPFNHPAVMYDKNFVLEVGGYPDIPLHEDYGLWVNLLKNGAVAQNLEETLCFMRIDDGLYSRRGGMAYLKTALRFRRHMHKIGFSSFFDMSYNSLAMIIVCLAPMSVRKMIYKKTLRKK